MAKSKLDKGMLDKCHLGKEMRAPPRMKFGGATWDELEQCHNMFKAPLSATVDQEHNLMQALCIAKVIMETRNGASEHRACFSQNCTCQKGIKTFGEKGRKAAGKEPDQLHQRNCFTPIDVNDLHRLHCGQQTDTPCHPDVPNQHAKRCLTILDFEVILQFRSRLISLFL